MQLPNHLILKQMEIGPMENFQYFLGDARTKEIAVVDPAWDVDYLLQEAERNEYKIKSVFLTHGHPDHVNGLKDLLAAHDVPAFISKHEMGILKPRHRNLVELDDRAKITIGNIDFEFLHTPGHSPGCHCIKYENALISGDTLFIDGCGRCDLPGSDPKQMYKSLYDVVMKLPDDTLIFPGHNYGPTPYATLGAQKQTNPYLTSGSMKEFLVSRMGVGF